MQKLFESENVVSVVPELSKKLEKALSVKKQNNFDEMKRILRLAILHQNNCIF